MCTSSHRIHVVYWKMDQIQWCRQIWQHRNTRARNTSENTWPPMLYIEKWVYIHICFILWYVCFILCYVCYIHLPLQSFISHTSITATKSNQGRTWVLGMFNSPKCFLLQQFYSKKTFCQNATQIRSSACLLLDEMVRTAWNLHPQKKIHEWRSTSC